MTTASSASRGCTVPASPGPSRGRYTSSLTVPNGAVTATTNWANVSGYTSTGASTLWTPGAGGLTFRKRGVYLLSLTIGCVAVFGGRNFVDVNVGS